MLTTVVQFMHFLHSSAVFLLNISFHIGRTIFLFLIKACHIIKDIFSAVAIIGEELYSFVCELNNSISAVSNYIGNSANSNINCALEAVSLFLRHMAKFFTNTRLHSKLLATQLMCFIGDILNLIKNALLLIADCAWWLITLLPRCLLYAFIAVGDHIVHTLTALRYAILNIIQAIIDDFFRLVIGFVLTFILWRNRGRVISVQIGWYAKLKRVVRRTRIRLIGFGSRLFRRRGNRAPSAPTSVQRRSPLPRNSISSASIGKKPLDVSQRCVVCRDRQKRVLLLPCKHLCLCDECADYLLFCTERRDCPLCRTHIEQSMSVYL